MHPLDNPVWHSLSTRHRGFACAHGAAVRYPADVARFLAVDAGDSRAADALAALIDPGESVLIVGPAPGPQFIELTDQHRTDLLELTALVYPYYFRPRTPDMGIYERLGYVRRIDIDLWSLKRRPSTASAP